MAKMNKSQYEEQQRRRDKEMRKSRGLKNAESKVFRMKAAKNSRGRR